MLFLSSLKPPRPLHSRVAKLVTSEFFDQGDLEKSKLKITPPALMDRDRKHELPLLQMRWIKDICLPLFDVRFTFLVCCFILIVFKLYCLNSSCVYIYEVRKFKDSRLLQMDT